MLGVQAEADSAGPFFDLCRASRDLYPEFAAALFRDTGIDIELDRSGTLYLAFTDDDVSEIRDRFAWQSLAGLAVEHLSADDARRSEPFISPGVLEALYFPGDWQVDNRKLCQSLKFAAELSGVDIRENTEVERLIVEDGTVRGAHTSTGTFLADRTLLATGAWTSLIKIGDAKMPVNIEPVRGQMIAFQTAKRLFQRVIYSRRGYLVPRLDGRILAGSTSENAGFDRSVTGSGATHLKSMAGEISPGIAGLEISDHWAGLRPFALDALPVMGPITGLDGLVFATAHYRNGILLAPVTAELATAYLLGEMGSETNNDFSPDRFRLRGVGKG
jgi:glycine oxidase